MAMDLAVGLNIEFRDSLNDNPQSLSKWPATFGLDNLSYGTFPHKFNRPENWDEILDYSDMEQLDWNRCRIKRKKISSSGIMKIRAKKT